MQSMEQAIKDKDGTIETLQRQLVQSGIKMQVGQASNEIRKDVLNTQAQQKLFKGMMKVEFERLRDEMRRDLKQDNTEKE
jgi:hypothetical protein